MAYEAWSMKHELAMQLLFVGCSTTATEADILCVTYSAHDGSPSHESCSFPSVFVTENSSVFKFKTRERWRRKICGISYFSHWLGSMLQFSDGIKYYIDIWLIYTSSWSFFLLLCFLFLTLDAVLWMNSIEFE